MERRAPGRRRKKNRATSVLVLLAILFLIAGFLARRIMAPAAVHHLRTLPVIPSGDPPSNGLRSEAGASKADGSRQSAQTASPNAYNPERNPEDLTSDERNALDRVIRERSHAPEADE